MATYVVNGVSFPNKDAVGLRAKTIKDSHKPGDILQGDERGFMLALLLWHPSAATKIGVGVRDIMIRANPMFGHNEFYLVRTDKSGTDFSYKQCLIPTTPEADLKTACRVAIAPDIIAFEHEFFRGRPLTYCPLTGERLTRENAHVDHMPPNTFAAIFAAFKRLERLVPERVALSGRERDNSFRVYLADKALEIRWVNYHRTHAHLRVISEEANLHIVGQTWDNIHTYLVATDHPDTLVEWKGKRRYYGHIPELEYGVLLSDERAPEDAPVFDGTIAVLEMSMNGAQP